jgi:hypothetical protein
MLQYVIITSPTTGLKQSRSSENGCSKHSALYWRARWMRSNGMNWRHFASKSKKGEGTSFVFLLQHGDLNLAWLSGKTPFPGRPFWILHLHASAVLCHCYQDFIRFLFIYHPTNKNLPTAVLNEHSWIVCVLWTHETYMIAYFWSGFKLSQVVPATPSSCLHGGLRLI